MNIHLSYEEKTNVSIGFAAREAAAYLLEMLPGSEISINNNFKETTDSLSIRLELMGQTPGGDGNDGFDIDITPKGGCIRGVNGRSVLIGVYHYLYLLGCRFLGPGKQCELVPVLETPTLLYRKCRKMAGTKHRGVCLEGANSLENILDFIDWLPKAGYNSFFLQFQLPYTFLARWYHHELNVMSAPETLTVQEAARMTRTITEEIKKRGLSLHQAGHGWTGDSVGVSSMDWKETSQHIKDPQRRMLAQLDGKREFFHGIPMNTNLCYSNPDAIEAFSDSVLRYVLSHGEVDYLHVWLADEYNNVCECGDCKKHLLSDQYLHILNEIDRKLCEHGCPTKIVFLIYQELLWAPETAVLKNPDRFVLMFAPISRTFDASYQIPDTLPPIPEYQRNRIALPVNLDENLAFLQAWQKSFSGDSFIYDYPLGRAHYGDFGYVHIAEIISQDIRQLHKLGLNGYISCQELRCGCPNYLPNYVMGRMLFDAEATFEETADEYFRAAYGDTHRQVRQYLTKLSSLCHCDYFNGKGSRLRPDVSARMEEAVRLTGDFVKLHTFPGEPEGNPVRLFHKLLDYHGRYIILLEQAIQFLAAGQAKKAQEYWEMFQDIVSSHETEFQPFLDVYRITEVSTKYTGFDLTEQLKRTL